LFEGFKDKWNLISATDKKRVIGIRNSKQIDTIDKAVNEDNIKSMIALIEYKVLVFQPCKNALNW
jgi:hypothetical protein